MSPNVGGAIAEPFDSNPEGSSSSVDDPRVAPALDEYLAELQAGRRPSREEFLGRYPEIRDALDRGLEVLEFVHSNAGMDASGTPDPPAADVLPPETILGDYRLIREVGRGGMGVVYEAQQVSLGRRVAVKVLSGAGVLDPRRLQRFRIEAQAVAQLNHPHIVPIFAVGHDRGIHYYAMQYVEGSTLPEVLENHPARRRGSDEETTLAPTSQAPSPSSGAATGSSTPEGSSLDPEESSFHLAPPAGGSSVAPIAGREAFRTIAHLGVQAAEGLDHAHAMGVLHRDIKPSNLLIDGRGNLWITDFGLARFRDESGLTLTGDLVGTLRYMAPEMAMGRRLSFDARSDIYSLGATLYELLTLRPVFPGTDRRELLRQIAQDEPVSPRRIDRTIPRDLETIVMKAMDKEPGRRYSSARELAEDLGRFLDDQPIQARPPSPWERVGKLAHRHRSVLMAASGVGLVALGIGSALLWQEQQRTAKAEGAYSESVRFLLADELTMSGMQRWAETARTDDDTQKQRRFYTRAAGFYERLTSDPFVAPRIQALAFRRLAFTRMVSRMPGTSPSDDYRRSITLYEKLLAVEPHDAELRDGLADAHYNLGLQLMNASGWPRRPDPTSGLANAEPSFRTAIRLQEERAMESQDLNLLDRAASTRLYLAFVLEKEGRKAESERERRALLDLYHRMTRPVLASDQAMKLSAGWATALYQSLAKAMASNKWVREQEEALRGGLVFQPGDPYLLLQLARLLASPADADPDRLREAVALAKKAGETASGQSEYWRVLALAHLRACEWSAAAEDVGASLKIQSKFGREEGQPSDGLLMAMVRWHQGRREEALAWYVRALDSMARNPDEDPEASTYWEEASNLLKPALQVERLAGEPGR